MTKIVGILNITPDSFSDGGKFFHQENALNHLREMIAQGADMIDVGAESTRPSSTPIDSEKEWLRLEKILPNLIDEVKKINRDSGKNVELSLDSYHFENQAKACEMGVDVINDVKGLTDEKMIELVAKTGKKTVFMHNLQIKRNPDLIINYPLNVVDEVYDFAQKKIAEVLRKNVKKSQLIFDVGIGFKKDAQQSIRVLKNIAQFKNLGLPIYVGHSKKRFCDEIYKNRDFGADLMAARAKKTLLVSAFLVRSGVDYLRVHDVKENLEVLGSGVVEGLE